MAAMAASGHHATPRIAKAPMTKKTPSQASVGHAVRSPRRAIRTTMAAALPKKRMPGTVRSEVGAHSEMRWVTSGFVDRPIA